MIVPYCEPCTRHLARSSILCQGAILGSVLMALSSSILLCLGWFSLVTIVSAATGLALLPLLFVMNFGGPRQLAHASRGRSVFFVAGGLAIASHSFAVKLAEDNGLVLKKRTLRNSGLSAWAITGPLLSVILSPFFFQVLRPPVRVLNFSDNRLEILVDERRLGDVEPTSSESPYAGREFRVPSGKHRLIARAYNRSDSYESTVVVRTLERHVFAPGSKPGCLYIQSVAYGRTSLGDDGEVRVMSRTPLESESRFWVIPATVEPWFLPERSLQRGVTTGGVVSLLRMGQCR